MPSDWNRLEMLFLRAVELTSELRTAFLDETCGDDRALRDQIEVLLAEHDCGTSFMETPAFESAEGRAGLETYDAAVDKPLRDAEDRSIGPYRVTRTIAAGGMGIVFEAQQQNPRRAVALKVIRGGGFMDGQRLRLFEREIRTLARLRHPFIAAIYEAGCTDDGEHYFAMELVPGEPLDQYADGRELSIRQRLILFCRICEGVSYAHQRGVIHRDLKPANILIVEDRRERQPGESHREAAAPKQDTDAPSLGRSAPQPKILDFGLARLVDADVSVTMSSAAGRIQGTLAYMSPEQARGDPDAIDVRSDVYSLGIILFELLTGQLPYNVKGTSLPEVLRNICEQSPKRPGVVNQALRGDLETILLKAIEKDPNQRYGGADALKDDIERFLENRPILARPPSTWYQIRKMASRHRAVSTLAAMLVLALLVFAVSAKAQSGHLAAERNVALVNQKLAEQAQQRANEVAHFMERLIYRLVGDEEGTVAGGREMLVAKLRECLERTVDQELDCQPEVEAVVREAIANTFSDLRLFDDVRRQMEKALAIRRCHYGQDHEEVVATLFHFGGLALACKAYSIAESQLTQAVDQAHLVFSDSDPRMATLLSFLSSIKRAQNDKPGAERISDQALTIRRRLLKPYVDSQPANESVGAIAPGFATIEPIQLPAMDGPIQVFAVDTASGDLLAGVEHLEQRTNTLVRINREGHSRMILTLPPWGGIGRVIQDRAPNSPSFGDWIAVQYNRILHITDIGVLNTIAAGPPITGLTGLTQDIFDASAPNYGDFVVTNVWPHAGFPPSQSPPGLFRVNAAAQVTAIHVGFPFERPSDVTQDLRTGDFMVTDGLAAAVYRVKTDGRITVLAMGPPLIKPTSIIQDGSTGDFLVADGAASMLFRISATGHVTPLTGEQPFKIIRSIVEEASGHYLVSDLNEPAVWRVSINP